MFDRVCVAAPPLSIRIFLVFMPISATPFISSLPRSVPSGGSVVAHCADECWTMPLCQRAIYSEYLDSNNRHNIHRRHRFFVKEITPTLSRCSIYAHRGHSWILFGWKVALPMSSMSSLHIRIAAPHVLPNMGILFLLSMISYIHLPYIRT